MQAVDQLTDVARQHRLVQHEQLAVDHWDASHQPSFGDSQLSIERCSFSSASSALPDAASTAASDLASEL